MQEVLDAFLSVVVANAVGNDIFKHSELQQASTYLCHGRIVCKLISHVELDSIYRSIRLTQTRI